MEDKALLGVIEDYLLFNDKEELENYIKNNAITGQDYKKLTLVLLKNEMFDYINCNQFKNVINHIDDDDFMNDEDNYI